MEGTLIFDKHFSFGLFVALLSLIGLILLSERNPVNNNNQSNLVPNLGGGGNGRRLSSNLESIFNFLKAMARENPWLRVHYGNVFGSQLGIDPRLLYMANPEHTNLLDTYTDSINYNKIYNPQDPNGLGKYKYS